MVSEPASASVSVILAAYNCSRLILRAVESVLSQTYNEIELIIVDDGSSDNTFEVLFPVLRELPNLKYLRHSNRKHPLSLNAGLANAESDYVTFLDCDDEYMQDHIRLRAEYMTVNSGLDLIYSPAKITGDESQHWVPDARDQSKLIHIDDCIIGGTIFAKRRVFEALGGFRDIYSHDSDFVKRARERFEVKMFDKRTYIYHRDNPESVTSKLRRIESD